MIRFVQVFPDASIREFQRDGVFASYVDDSSAVAFPGDSTQVTWKLIQWLLQNPGVDSRGDNIHALAEDAVSGKLLPGPQAIVFDLEAGTWTTYVNGQPWQSQLDPIEQELQQAEDALAAAEAAAVAAGVPIILPLGSSLMSYEDGTISDGSGVVVRLHVGNDHPVQLDYWRIISQAVDAGTVQTPEFDTHEYRVTLPDSKYFAAIVAILREQSSALFPQKMKAMALLRAGRSADVLTMVSDFTSQPALLAADVQAKQDEIEAQL